MNINECPGVPGYGRGLNGTNVHVAGCCNIFASTTHQPTTHDESTRMPNDTTIDYNALLAISHGHVTLTTSGLWLNNGQELDPDTANGLDRLHEWGLLRRPHPRADNRTASLTELGDRILTDGPA